MLDRPTYLPYRGAIPFCFYLAPLRLVSRFLNVGALKFLVGSWLILLQNCITVKKGGISSSILEKITWIIRKLVKILRIRHLNGQLNFSSS